MDIFYKVKEYYKKLKNIKNIEIWITVLIMAIILSLFASTYTGPKKDIKESVPTVTSLSSSDNSDKSLLEQQLANILSQIDGVGAVSVMITFETTSEKVPAMDTQNDSKTTEERDNQGGERKITEETTQSQHVILNQQGSSQPMILKEIAPKVKGVIVVAEGGGNVSVQAAISHAVEAVLDVPAHKITVFPMKKNDIKGVK